MVFLNMLYVEYYFKISVTGSWGDGSVVNVFTLQMLGTEFRSPEAHIKTGGQNNPPVILALEGGSREFPF